jgi:uncharacterized protein (UPF0548 family)
MFLLRKPTDDLVRSFLIDQAKLGFTYEAVGATASVAPTGFQLDHSRFKLGNSEELFEKAKAAIRRWNQFDLGWAYAQPNNTPIGPNQTVAVVIRTLGIWCICSARIVFVIDEPNRFGFAYGTLPGHAECGEERFMVEKTDDGSVWYDILVFSQPRHLLAKIGNPFVRRLQKRFVRMSGEAMVRSVNAG